MHLHLPCNLINVVIFYFLKSSNNILPAYYSIIEGKHPIVDQTEFEAHSKRAWTDVFLQIYKVTFPLLFIAGFFWVDLHEEYIT